MSPTLQTRRQDYFEDLNIIIFVCNVGLYILFFYTINMNVMSLSADSSSLFLVNLYLNEWISLFDSSTSKHTLSSKDTHYQLINIQKIPSQILSNKKRKFHRNQLHNQINNQKKKRTQSKLWENKTPKKNYDKIKEHIPSKKIKNIKFN